MMGRLAKAFALDRESSRLMPFDEQQLLREASLIAARLRSELDGTSEPATLRHEQDDIPQALAELHLAFQTGDNVVATGGSSTASSQPANRPAAPATPPALQSRQWEQTAAELDRREAELSQRETALAHSVQAALVELKLRSERELREQSSALEAEWNERGERLTREREEWVVQYDAQQAQLHVARQTAESETVALRTLRDEHDALRLKLDAQSRDIEMVRHESLQKTRADITAIVECEHAKLETQRVELERLTREQTEFVWQKRRELDVELNQLRTQWQTEQESARQQAEQHLLASRSVVADEQRELHLAIEQWHAQRADEALLLREERQQIDATRQDVEAAAAALATERQELLREVAGQRAQFEREVACQRADFEREVAERRSAVESAISSQQDLLQQRTADFEASHSQRVQVLEDRERLFAEKSAQQDGEWTARCRTIEHDQRLQAELTQKRLAEERAYFDAQCVRREAALADESTADHADIVRQRRQLEEERDQVRHSLQQMDRQLRLITSNFESPRIPTAITRVDGRLTHEPTLVTLRLDNPSQTVPVPHLLEATARPVETVLAGADRATNNDAEVSSSRRRALEQYRQMLGELQTQVNELVASREDSARP